MSAVQGPPVARTSPPPAPVGPPVVADLRQRVSAFLARWPVAWATVIASVGLLVQTIGYAQGWADHRVPALLLWYAGFVLLVAPFAALLLAPTRTDHQRLGGSLAFTLLLYGSWLFYNPVLSTRFDETLHVATLVGLADGDGFFSPNPMLPVSPHYPGLELAAGGVHWLTGAPLFACQVFVVLVARTTFVLALFLLASRIGRSTRVGAATVVLYSASAQFYFFNAQFSYQTIAIALMMAALYLLVRAFDSAEARPWRPLLGAQVCLAALTVSHHVTSAFMLIMLWALTAWFHLGGERRRFRLTLVTAEIFTVVTAAWTAVVAPLLVSYLGPVVKGASDELFLAFEGGSQREVGVSQSGAAAPSWQVLVMAGSIALWLLLLAPAAWKAWRGGTMGTSRARLVPLLVALVYPLLQVARVSTTAAELGDRLSTFVGMAMALIVGSWLVPRLHQFGRLIIPAALLLILGGTILGSGPDWQRIPGPYLAGAQQRSIDARSVAVAEWTAKYVPEGSRIATDYTFSRLLPDFAPVTPVNVPGGLSDVTPMFEADTVDASVITTIQEDEIDFVLVDERMIGQQARSGALMESALTTPDGVFTEEELTKFEGQPGFDLVLDGPVKMYDVRSLHGAPSTWVDEPDGGLPGTWTPWQLVVAGVLLVVGLLLRGRLLDPRRFRARDLWRLAVVLPASMVVGVAGVLAGFSPVIGTVVAVLLLGALVGATPRPRRLATGTPRVVTLAWSGVITALVVSAALVAIWAAWHGLTDFPALAPPIGSGIS